MSNKIQDYIEAIARDSPHALTPLEELALLGIDPCELYFGIFCSNSGEEEFPGMPASGEHPFCSLLEEPEEYEEYDARLVERCPLLKDVTRHNLNRRIYEA